MVELTEQEVELLKALEKLREHSELEANIIVGYIEDIKMGLARKIYDELAVVFKNCNDHRVFEIQKQLSNVMKWIWEEYKLD